MTTVFMKIKRNLKSGHIVSQKRMFCQPSTTFTLDTNDHQKSKGFYGC